MCRERPPPVRNHWTASLAPQSFKAGPFRKCYRESPYDDIGTTTANGDTDTTTPYLWGAQALPLRGSPPWTHEIIKEPPSSSLINRLPSWGRLSDLDWLLFLRWWAPTYIKNWEPHFACMTKTELEAMLGAIWGPAVIRLHWFLRPGRPVLLY